MSQSQPSPQTTQPKPSQRIASSRAVHVTALIAVVACPLLALIPPRKLDVYTVGLVGTTAYSANHLVRESSGRSIWQHVNRPNPQQMGLPWQNEGTRETWKAQREKEIQEDIKEGKGFGDMIIDQIWEVWNWGKPKDG